VYTPVHKYATSPDLLSQPGNTVRRTGGWVVEAKTLGYTHSRADCHPSLVWIIRALQISANKEQTLT